MLPGRALARTFALVGVAGVIAAGLGTGTALAAGTVTVPSGQATALNTQTRTITFTTSDAMLPSPAPVPTVTMTRNGSSDAAIPGTSVSVTSAGLPPTTQVTATFNFTMANPTDPNGAGYDVEIKQGSFDDTCTSCFHVLGSTPTVTSVSPNTLGLGGTTQPFIITGTNFANGPYDGTPNAGTVTLLLAGTQNADPAATLGPTVDGNGNPAPTAPTATTIQLRLQLAPGAGGAHDDDVVVTNTDGKKAICSACLHITPQPVISSIALTGPGGASIGQNAQNQQLVITGTNFAPDSAVTIAAPAQNVGAITFTQPALVNAAGTQITLNGVNTTTVTSAATGSAHKWAVTVSSPTLHNASAASLLTVNPAPTASSITYEGGGTDVGQGATSRHVTVGGSNIVDGTQIVFAGLPNTVVQHDEIVNTGAQTVAVQLDVPQNATIASYDVTLVNPDGGTSDLCATASSGVPPTSSACPLSVAAGPSISTISPNTVTAPYTGQVVITGTNLHSNVLVTIAPASGAPYLSNFAATPTGSGATKTITIPAGHIAVPPTQRVSDADVTVTNVDDGGTKTATGSFHVVNLSLSGVNPSAASNDQPLTGVAVDGANFDQDASVLLRKAGLDDIPGTGVSVAPDGTSLTADFNVKDVGPGDYQVIVTNPDDPNTTTDHPGQAANPAVVLTVLANDPTTTDVSPTALGGGATQVPVTVTGTNFYPGSVLTFDNPAITLVPNSPPVIDKTRTHITQLVNVASNAGTGSAAATVTNSAGFPSNSQNITIDAAPTVVGLTPATHSPDPFDASIAGSGFQPGAVLQFDNPGVHATNVQVVDPSTITAHLTFDAGTVPGDAPVDVAVTVVNPDFGQATTPGGSGLTLNPEPRITSATPDLFAVGKSASITLTGANFEDQATLTAPNNSGVTITNPQFQSSGAFTATIAVDPGTARGPVTLTLTNPDSGHATTDINVYVAPSAPNAPSSPAQFVTPGNGALDLAWAAPTSDGGGALTGYDVTVTPHGGAALPTQHLAASSTTYSFGGLTNGQPYDVSLVAVNGAGSGPALTGSGTPRTTPSAPTALSVMPGNGTLSVTWAAPASDGGNAVDKYTVNVTPHAGGTTTSFDTADATTTSHDFSGLANGTLYDVSVVAHNAAGNGTAVTGTGTPRTTPGAPTALSVTPGNGTLSVSWAAPASDGGNAVDKYTVGVTPHAGGTTTSSTQLMRQPHRTTSAVSQTGRSTTCPSLHTTRPATAQRPAAPEHRVRLRVRRRR